MRIEGIKNRLRTDRHFRRLLCALLLAVGLAVTGFSLAYFTSVDKTTNRMTSDFTNPLAIVLTEPNWNSAGEFKAQKFVAGMEIEKDPYATNYMAVDVYLRLKITVYDSNGNEVTLGDNETLKLVTYDTSAEKSTNDYSAFLSTIYYNDTQLFESNNTNPYFYYSDGYFYYLNYNDTETASELKSLTYKEKTAVPLFTTVKLPVFDSEYDTFENGFKIVVTAEAVDVSKFVDSNGNKTISVTDSDSLTNIKAVFRQGDSLNSGTSAVYYDSDTAVNKFTPGTVSVSVKENDEILTTTENTIKWDTTATTADKKVQIHCNDTETSYASCYVRACLVPKWESGLDNTNTTFEVLDNENTDSDGNDIVFPASINGNTFMIDGVTFTLADDWADNWIYKDGYFYYKKILSPGEDTEPLLESVSVTASDLTKHTDNGEYLGVSVLTDAIQSDGGAVIKKWNATVESDVISAVGGQSNE